MTPLRHWLRQRKEKLLADLDAEKIGPFQTVIYYPLIMWGGFYLLLASNAPPDPVAGSMGHPLYELWAGCNIVCPAMTYLGKWQWNRAAAAAPGVPNTARAGAWWQFGGDGGVWGVILIYFACFLQNTYWGQPLYTTWYFLMGIPGGFAFTFRSLRRIRQIRKRDRQ